MTSKASRRNKSPLIDIPDKCLLPILADDGLCPRLRLRLSATLLFDLNKTSLSRPMSQWAKLIGTCEIKNRDPNFNKIGTQTSSNPFDHFKKKGIVREGQRGITHHWKNLAGVGKGLIIWEPRNHYQFILSAELSSYQQNLLFPSAKHPFTSSCWRNVFFLLTELHSLWSMLEWSLW